MNNFIIAKCIEAFSPRKDTIELKFDRDINYECEILGISINAVYTFTFLNNQGIYIKNVIDIDFYRETFLGKYVIIFPTYMVNKSRTRVYPTKEEIWQQLGSLDNPELEEIDLYIKLLNKTQNDLYSS